MRLAVASSILSAALFVGGEEVSVKPVRLEMQRTAAVLTWEGEEEGVYRVERSVDLGESGWQQRGLVQSRLGTNEWADPDVAGAQVYYRLQLPGIEVGGIEVPVVGPLGAEWMLSGKRIPAGSLLELYQADGAVVARVELEFTSGEPYRISLPQLAVEEGQLLRVRVVNAEGTLLTEIDQTVQVTASGRGADAPAWTSLVGNQAAQDHNSSRSNKTASVVAPDPDSGGSLEGWGEFLAAQDHNASRSNKTSAIALPDFGGGDDTGGPFGDAEALLIAWASKKGYDYYQAQSAMASKKGYDYYQAQSAMASKKGYDYYQAQSAMASKKGYDYYQAQSQMRSALPALPGELAFVEVDMEVPARVGYGLAWARVYRSTKDIAAGHGAGWDHAYNIYLELVGPVGPSGLPDAVRIHDGSGRVDLYRLMADGTFRADGLFREGAFGGDGEFQLRHGDGSTWNFHVWNETAVRGKIASIGDRNANALAFVYDEAGRLIEVSNNSGGRMTVTWGESKIARVADQTGRAVDFSYYQQGEAGGSVGQLRGVGGPLFQGQTAEGSNVLYGYAAGGGSGGTGLLTSITDGEGRLVESYVYADTADPTDPAYRTVASINRWDLSTGESVPTEAHIHIAALAADQLPRGGYVMYFNDEEGRCSEHVFDAMHRMVKLREYNGFALPGAPVTAGTNRPGAPLRDGDAEFVELQFAYNADHLLRWMRMADGTEMSLIRGREWQPAKSPRKRGDTAVLALRATNGAERKLELQYHPEFGVDEDTARGAGIAMQLPGPLQPTATGGFNFGPFVTELRNGEGQVWRNQFDVRGNLAAAYSPVAGYAEHFEYNANGQLVSHTLVDGERQELTNFHYEPASMRMTQWIPDPAEEGALQEVTTLVAFDSLARVAQITDPDGHDWLFQWNARNQCVSEETPPVGSDPETTARIARTFIYDRAGLLVRSDLEHRDPAGVLDLDNPHYTTIWEYDGRGRLSRIASEARPISMEAKQIDLIIVTEAFDRVTFGYSAAGLPVGMQQDFGPVSILESYAYDARGQLYRFSRGPSEDPATPQWQMDYDELGALTALSLLNPLENEPVGTVYNYIFAYDELHRLAAMTTPQGARVDYRYDATGFVICEWRDVRPNGEGVPADVLYARTRQFVHELPNPESAMRGIPTPAVPNSPATPPIPYPLPEFLTYPGVTDVCYEIKTAKLVQGRVNSRRIDQVDRFKIGEEASAVRETTTSSYSPAGLLSGITDAAGATLTVTYDMLGRVESVSSPATTYTYSYSRGGNNQLCGKSDHFIIGPSGGGGDPWIADPEPFTATLYFEHDPLGRVKEVRDGQGNTATILYDSLDRVRQVSKLGGGTLFIRYDGSTGGNPWTTEATIADGQGGSALLDRSYARGDYLLRSDDSYGYATSYDYDQAGRLVHVIHPDGMEELMDIASPFERTKIKRRSGAVITSINEVHGSVQGSLGHRLTRNVTQSEKDLLPVADQVLTLDILGRPVELVEGEVAHQWDWDSTGAMVSHIHGGGHVVRDITANGRASITYPNGTQLIEERDSLGRILASWIAPLDPADEPFQLAVFSYQGNRLYAQRQSNGVITKHYYRGDGAWPLSLGEEADDLSFDALIGVEVTGPLGEVLHTSILRRAHFQEAISAEYVYGNPAIAATRKIVLDRDSGRGHLTSLTRSFRPAPELPFVEEDSRQWTYDLEGRRLTESSGSLFSGDYFQNPTIPPADRQMGRYSSWPAGALEWNSAGAMAGIQHPSGDLSFSHDAYGRLRSISSTSDGSLLLQLNPDPLGRYAGETTGVPDPDNPAASRLAHMDGDQILMESDGSGSLLYLFVHYNGRLVAQYETAAAQWIFPVVVSSNKPPLILPIKPNKHPFSNPTGDEPGTGKGGLGFPIKGLPFFPWMGRAVPAQVLPVGIYTSAEGSVLSRIHFDPFGKPVNLLPDGRVASSSEVGPIRWMAPEVLLHAIRPSEQPDAQPISLLDIAGHSFLPDPAAWMRP